MQRTERTIAALLIALVVGGCSSPKGQTGQAKRDSVMTMEKNALAELYNKKPETKAEIANAPGYAVFSDMGMGLLILGSGNGYGVVTDNQTHDKIFMKMVQGSVGFGVGLKDYRTILIFQDRKTLEQFDTKGWEFGAQAGAGVQSGEKGGSVSGAAYASGIKIYQMTQAGIEIRASLPLTKYYRYDELN
jgi:lipid-binding SYLF domain-containing protein